MASARRYTYTGAIILAISGAIAIYFNFQGVRCLSDLALVDRSITAPGHLQEMERNCSIVTNSYVYSIYGAVAGIVLVVVGLVKKGKGNVS
jgi:hypothetical protein